MIVESGPPSVLDSPTLARVERARIREEGDSGDPAVKLASFCPSVVSERGGEMQHAIKKGLLWQQRERLFSRWKERFFILTRDYLHCFKRSSGQDKISDMGQFIFKVKLVEVETIEWINKKSYSTIAVQCRGVGGRGDRESRVLLRAPDGLEDWYELLEECMMTSKERRRALRRLHNPLWAGDDDSPSLTWLINRGTLNREGGHLSDSVPDLEGRGHGGNVGGEVGADEALWARPRGTPLEQRLSLLTDIDINSCSSQTETPPPSVAATLRGRPYPCRLNADVFFMSSTGSGNREGSVTASYCSSRSPLALTPAGSFRNGHQLFSPAKSAVAAAAHIKYRDRSQSDALNWRSRTAELKSRRSSYLNDVTHV